MKSSHIAWSALDLWPLIYPKLSKLNLSFRNHIYWIIIKLYDNVSGYNILPKFVNQLITLSIQVIQIDNRHLLSSYMPISLVYFYTGIFCDMDTLVFLQNYFRFCRIIQPQKIQQKTPCLCVALKDVERCSRIWLS